MTKPANKKEKQPKRAFTMNYPEEVFQEIERLAEEEERSTTGQIIFMIKDFLARRAGQGISKS